MKLNLFVLLVVLHSIVDLPSLVSEEQLGEYIDRKAAQGRRIPQGAAREAWLESLRNSLRSTHNENNASAIIDMIRNAAR